jgi:rare lipoprotein A
MRAVLPAPVAPVAPPAPAAAAPAQSKSSGYAIQIAALTDHTKALSLARSVGGRVEPVGAIFRVRTGPYATPAAAFAALIQMRAKGFADARVVTNGGR